MTKISTQPYKGTTDTYPKDMLERNYVFNTWSKVAKRFGFEEYDTPMLEDAEIYRVKSGEELANTQLYNFTDKGGREIALRPEMTPSVARMIAEKINELPQPIKWFNIGRFYRYEKPQRGRRREFFQLNIDIFGVSTLEAELEIIQFVMSVMDEFKAPKETYELRINNRYLFEYLCKEILNINEDIKGKLARAIDNYLKMDSNSFVEYLVEIGLDKDQSNKVLEYLTWDIPYIEKLIDKSEGAKQLVELFSKASQLGITNISFNPSVMRGLQYYTGTVIEMFDIGSKENPRALFGGGRYDDLLTIFDRPSIPAFGLGWGDITTMDYLKTYNLIPDIDTQTEIFLTLMDSSLYIETDKLAQYLRSKGINTQMQLTDSKLKNQFKYADKKNIPWVIVLGDKEIEENRVLLKNMITQEEFLITKEDVVDKIKA